MRRVVAQALRDRYDPLRTTKPSRAPYRVEATGLARIGQRPRAAADEALEPEPGERADQDREDKASLHGRESRAVCKRFSGRCRSVPVGAGRCRSVPVDAAMAAMILSRTAVRTGAGSPGSRRHNETVRLSASHAVSYDKALDRGSRGLKTEGFGVLTEIDVAAPLKKKLDVDFWRYKIPGACNPALAHQALGVMLEVGVMLPCNVIVYERDGGGATVVAIDPSQTMAADDPRLVEIAAEVRQRLVRVIDQL